MFSLHLHWEHKSTILFSDACWSDSPSNCTRTGTTSYNATTLATLHKAGQPLGAGGTLLHAAVLATKR